MRKQIIILTKSIKRGGYCVAGIDVNNGEWVRMVSNDIASEHAVLIEHMQYANGTTPNIYDIVEIDFVGQAATQIQPENWRYNNNVRWVKIGVSNLVEVLALHPYENPRYIFYNTDKAITNNDIVYGQHCSLMLANISNVSINVRTFPERKKVDLSFTYKNNEYRYISVTDEEKRNRFLNRPDGSYLCGNNLPVVFSLTDIHEGKYYKIAAQLL